VNHDILLNMHINHSKIKLVVVILLPTISLCMFLVFQFNLLDNVAEGNLNAKTRLARDIEANPDATSRHRHHDRRTTARNDDRNRSLSIFTYLIKKIDSSDHDLVILVQSAYEELELDDFRLFMGRLIEHAGETLPLEILIDVYDKLEIYKSLPEGEQMPYRRVISSIDRSLTTSAPSKLYELYEFEPDSLRQHRLLAIYLEGMILKSNDITVATDIITNRDSDLEKRILIGMVTSLLWVKPPEDLDKKQLESWLEFLEDFISFEGIAKSTAIKGRDRVIDVLNGMENNHDE